jgi:mRNA-degrading endonuclease RelE of RelBE toxin-antitoxin system
VTARRGGKSKQEKIAAPAAADAPPREGSWHVRFAQRILSEDLKKIGHAALEVARATIDKKLKLDPEKYGQRLHSPLHGLYKLKASHIRIAYHVEKATREVWVLMIGNRREIWDEDEAEILDRLGLVRRQVDEDVTG